MRRYQFIVGVSLAALEAELNRIANDEDFVELRQVFYVQGTGFVAAVERLENAQVERTQQVDKPAKPATNSGKSRKNS